MAQRNTLNRQERSVKPLYRDAVTTVKGANAESGRNLLTLGQK